MSGCEGSEPFALRVLGDSMEPEFHEGEILIIEPGSGADDGSFVIVQHEGEFFFRKLCRDQQTWYLKPMNSRYPTLKLSDKSSIKGKILSKSSGKGRQTTSYP